MATEEGIVTSVSGATAWIKTKRSDACDHCSSKDSCKTLGGGGEMAVEVINRVGAKPGDHVVVNFKTSSLLKATFLIYVLPILCLMAGAGIGVKLSETVLLSMDRSVLSAITGFGAFAIALGGVKIWGNRMAKKESYRPSIIRIKPSRKEEIKEESDYPEG